MNGASGPPAGWPLAFSNMPLPFRTFAVLFKTSFAQARQST